jgi:hypothetical protein
MTHKKILAFIIIVGLGSFLLGLLNTIYGNFNEVVWALCPIGIFVWGDAIILGPFLAVSAIWLWRRNNPTISGMFLSLYASVRSFIEIIYNLNAQFTTTVRPWDPYWQDTKVTRFFGIIETNVLAQVLFTVVIIISLFVFLTYLRRFFKESFFSAK